jgi:hypothetical protein
MAHSREKAKRWVSKFEKKPKINWLQMGFNLFWSKKHFAALLNLKSLLFELNCKNKEN